MQAVGVLSRPNVFLRLFFLIAVRLTLSRFVDKREEEMLKIRFGKVRHLIDAHVICLYGARGLGQERAERHRRGAPWIDSLAGEVRYFTPLSGFLRPEDKKEAEIWERGGNPRLPPQL